jgi:hypothetical protein
MKMGKKLCWRRKSPSFNRRQEFCLMKHDEGKKRDAVREVAFMACRWSLLPDLNRQRSNAHVKVNCSSGVPRCLRSPGSWYPRTNVLSIERGCKLLHVTVDALASREYKIRCGVCDGHHSVRLGSVFVSRVCLSLLTEKAFLLFRQSYLGFLSHSPSSL